jgi:hypothetical protein
MSNVTGPSSAGRPELPPADPAATEALVRELEAIPGSGPRWLSFLDGDSSTKKLALALLRDGKFDAEDAKKLVQDAKDYGKISSAEKQVFANLLRDHAGQMTPEARDALAKFFGLPIGRPALVTPAFPGEIAVKEGTSEYSLDDDTLIMTGDGEFSSSIGRDIYTAGYLPMKDGPMLKPMGTPAAPSSILSPADNAINKERSPVDRFDEVMKRATGTSGQLASRYAKEGKRDEADSWWGFCDRWSYSALDPEVATRVNRPILYKGVYFSTAELRGLASFLGRSDEGGGLFDKDVTPLDLQKAVTLYLKKNGPGFIGDVWLDKAHPGNSQVWNQPFDAVDQKVRELQGDELGKVLKEQFKLSGDKAEGKRIFYVETTGHYGVEAGEEHEGAATHSTKTWKSYILTEPDGRAIDGKWAPGSDDALEYIWRPGRTGNFAPEAKFFRDLLRGGVPQEKATAFEKALAALPPGPCPPQKKAELRSQFAGVAAAYPDAALAAKLAPYGLSVADFN